MTPFDIAIIGGGMAGASLAAELAGHATVVILEAEAQPGYHATGRSAAFWSETYGGPSVQPLTTASGPWLQNPPAEFHESRFLYPRGEVNLGREKDQQALEDFVANFSGSSIALEWLDRGGIEARCNFLKPEWDRGVAVPTCADIDVAALHQAYFRAAKRLGAVVRCSFGVARAHFEHDMWTLETSSGAVSARILVNAAGAWADEVGAIAGVAPIGIRPFRRTMLEVTLDRPVPNSLALHIDIEGKFYFKSDGSGGLLLSPHDETATHPQDVAPEEIDVARAIDRFERIAEARVIKVRHKWAGLRSFSADRLPVYGFDSRNAAFFWFAGQGGFGIQTAPAAARLAAQIVLGKSPDDMTRNIDAERFAPSRFT